METIKETTYQVNMFDLTADVNMGNTNLIWTRGRMYVESSVIQNVEKPCIIEVHGYLPLEQKFKMWDAYGEPNDDLYFCVVTGRIVKKEDLVKDNSIEWPIGWISKNNYVVVFVDIVGLLNQYYLINQAALFDSQYSGKQNKPIVEQGN